MKKIKNLKQAQMPAFAQIFAIIIGIIILFLAIYFIGKMIGTKTYEEEVELVRSFDILLDPFASIGGMGPISMDKKIKLPQESIIEFSCYQSGDELGGQGLRLKSKSSFRGWGDFTEQMIINDKYVFSENLQGKEFHVLSKSFELPFRIDDLIYLISEEYCFIDAPKEIKEEFGGGNASIPKIKFDEGDCKGKIICFDDGANCDMIINGDKCTKEFFCENVYNYGTIEKVEEGKTLNFVTDALLYAAIFSDSKTYECNFKRLMSRLKILCDIYEEKAGTMDVGCSVGIMGTKISNFKNNIDENVIQLYILAEELADENSYAKCPVF